jgi:SAM-dependent methyltransferase
VTPRRIPAEIPALHRTERGSFRPGWRWPADVRRWFARQLSSLQHPAPRPIANIPSGSSKLGDIRVDKYVKNADVRADFFHLPFADGALGTIVCDPPFELNTHERIRLHKELGRVLRPGGLLLWQAPWLPNEGVFDIETIHLWSQRVGLPRNARILVRAVRRYPGPRVGQGQKKHPRD